MHRSASSSQEVWKRLSFENKGTKITSKTLTQLINLHSSDQNREEDQSSHKIFASEKQHLSQQQEYMGLEEMTNQSPPSFAKQKRHSYLCCTERAPVTSLIVQEQLIQSQNMNYLTKRLMKSTFKQKLTRLKSILNQVRIGMLKINDELQQHRKEFEQSNTQAKIKLDNLFQIAEKQNIELIEGRKIQLFQLEQVIKIKEERIGFLTSRLEDLRNENMDLNEKLFDMNQKVVQSDLYVQEKVKEIMEAKLLKQGQYNIPRLEGEVFDISHIKHESKQQSSRQLQSGEQSRVYLQIQQEEPSTQKLLYEYKQEKVENESPFYGNQHKLFPHLKIRPKFKQEEEAPHLQKLNLYEPCTLVPHKASTPTNKTAPYPASLTRIKSQETNLNAFKSNSYMCNSIKQPFSRVSSGYFQKVGSPKSYTALGSKGLSRNDGLVGKQQRHPWKEERNKIASKYANINASLCRMEESGCVRKEQKLSKLGSRIEQLRNEIKKQIHAYK